MVVVVGALVLRLVIVAGIHCNLLWGNLIVPSRLVWRLGFFIHMVWCFLGPVCFRNQTLVLHLMLMRTPHITIGTIVSIIM